MQLQRIFRFVIWGLAIAGLGLGISGYAMAASFSVAAPAQLSHWQRVATWYGALAIASLVLLGALIVTAIRQRQRRTASANL